MCRVHGAPDLFVTFTCNPKWQEVADAPVSEPGQLPDIVTRVFHMKYMEFLQDVKNGVLFGPIKACTCAFRICCCSVLTFVHFLLTFVSFLSCFRSLCC